MSMNDCQDCTASARQMHCGFRSDCVGCCARVVARSPQFFNSRKAGRQSRDYLALLETFRLSHQQVLDAHKADAYELGEAA